jgi:hypothetical protein
MFNQFNGTNDPVPEFPDSEFQKVEFTMCTSDQISLQMNNHVIKDELSILKDTLIKKWYSFSTKNQVVKIYSKLNQTGFLNVAKKYVDKIEHIDTPMEKVENIKQVIENEINSYNHNDDTYIIISVMKDMYKTDSVDNHYALIT